MNKIMLFAGTVEGRELALYLQSHRIHSLVCVATEYGEKLIAGNEYISVSSKRLSMEEMLKIMAQEDISAVIDATHPYAFEVSMNVKTACKQAGLEYIRLLRESGEISSDKYLYFNNSREAAGYLEKTDGKVLLTTGSKELKEFTSLTDYRNRLYARVLPSKEVVEDCLGMGIEGKNLICMQGPFTEELNYAMIRQVGAKYLVTKDSGNAGGFIQKIEAADRAGIKVLIIGRPPEEDGISYTECISYLNKKFGIERNTEITVVGIGMGGKETMTLEAVEACEKTEIIIGASRVLDALRHFGKPSHEAYNSEEIYDYIKNRCDKEKIVIAFSGDVNFYSGAKKMLDKLKEYHPKIVCGISSVVYFAGKIGKSWDDMKLISMHGRKSNIIAAVQYHKKVFSLLGGRDSVSSLCKTFLEYGLQDLKIWIGENLSYPEEKITFGCPKDFIDMLGEKLSVIVIENPDPGDAVITHGIKDEEFIRDEVPMTKEEIRSISLSKLRLEKDSIVYDIGAGTGSVSVEMALQAIEGQVYAIEKNPKAVNLIERNMVKFRTDNINVTQDLAPCASLDTEIPTHAFIGGTSGNLRQILQWIFEKNPRIRIVINVVTLESLSEVMECIKHFSLSDVEIVQASIAKSRTLGKYHLMTGLNPVHIISFTGGDD